MFVCITVAEMNWFGLVLWHINHCRLLMPNPFLYIWAVLFQAIQFNISTLFSSIWPIERTLLGATPWGQSGPGSNGNEGILRIPQSSSITEASPSDCLVSYQWHSLGRGYPSAEKQLVYSTAKADRERIYLDQFSFL